MIGRKVHIIIDRPLGTYHPKHKNILYTVNYGYVRDVLGGDGEEQDVYLLGIDVPLSEFDGTVIAVIHRHNDNEDKWVAVPEGMNFTDEEILAAVDFQERFFDITLER